MQLTWKSLKQRTGNEQVDTSDPSEIGSQRKSMDGTDVKMMISAQKNEPKSGQTPDSKQSATKSMGKRIMPEIN